MPDDTPEIRFWKDETLRVIKATLDDTPAAPCEECRVPLELDISIATPETPRTRSQRHLCASCRRSLDMEKWLDKDDIRTRGGKAW